MLWLEKEKGQHVRGTDNLSLSSRDFARAADLHTVLLAEGADNK